MGSQEINHSFIPASLFTTSPLPVPMRDAQCSVAEVIKPIDVGAATQKEFDDLHPTSLRRVHQRRPALRINCIHVGTLVQCNDDLIKTTLSCGQYQSSIERWRWRKRTRRPCRPSETSDQLM